MQKINTRQLCIIVVLAFSLTKFNIMPAFLSSVVGEGLIFTCLLNFLIDFFLLLIILKVINNYKNLTFYEILKVNFGEKLSKFISFLFVIFFLIKGLILISEQKNSIELTFYETQPNFLTFFPFFVIAFFVMLKGYTTFARSFEICLFLGIIGLLAIILLSIGAGNYTYLLPIFGQPLPKILKASFSSFVWFGDPIYILMFAGYLKKESNFKKPIIISYFIATFITLLIFAIFYAVFESIAPRQYFAILKMSKYSISLSNIGRFDYLASILLSLVNVYTTILPLLFCSNLLKEIFNFKKVYLAPLFTSVVVLAFSLLSQHNFLTFITFSQNYLVWFFISLTYILPILLLLKSRRKQYGV